MDTNYEDMLGLCKVMVIGTVGGEHITCRSHNGNLRSLHNLHGIHHILHNRHSHSRAQPRPHACRSSHHGSHRSSYSLHILHGILRIHCIRSKAQQRPQVRLRPHACHSSPCRNRSLHNLHSHSRAQPQPHACRSSPCCIQDRNHHSLHILQGRLRIHRIRSRAQLQPLLRLQARQPQWLPGRELRASSCCQL